MLKKQVVTFILLYIVIHCVFYFIYLTIAAVFGRNRCAVYTFYCITLNVCRMLFIDATLL